MAVPSSGESALGLPDVDDGNLTLRDEFINGLVQGSAWTFGADRILTYSFNINELVGSYPGGEPQPGNGGAWSDSPGFEQAVEAALGRWADVADIGFERISSGEYYFESTADLAIALAGNDLDRPRADVAGAAYYPDPQLVDSSGYVTTQGWNRTTWPTPEGDIFFDNDDAPFAYLDPGGAGFSVILHEIGHALGLKHPHDHAGGRPKFSELGIGEMDEMRYTVMSYGIADPPYENAGFAATPMPLDILAIQHIYGANLAYRTGDDVYDLDNESFWTIWDAGGDDTLDAGSWVGGSGVMLDLREGGFSGAIDSERRMAVAYDAVIENAIGSSQGDKVFGNDADNRLQGGWGKDALFGGGGSDQLSGGAGVDRLRGGAGDDVLLWGARDRLVDGGSGRDTLLLTGGDLDLGAVPDGQIDDIEWIDMTGGGDSRLTLSAQDLLDLSSSSNRLKVLGDAGDFLDISGFTARGGPVSGFQTYRHGAATLLVDMDVTVAVI